MLPCYKSIIQHTLTHSGVGLKLEGLSGSNSCLFLDAVCFLNGINGNVGTGALEGNDFVGGSYEDENVGSVSDEAFDLGLSLLSTASLIEGGAGSVGVANGVLV